MNCFLEEQSCRCSEQKKMFLCRFHKNTPPKRPLSSRFRRSEQRPIERTHNFTWGNSGRLLPYLSPFGGQRGCPTSSVSFSFQRSCLHNAGTNAKAKKSRVALGPFRSHTSAHRWTTAGYNISDLICSHYSSASSGAYLLKSTKPAQVKLSLCSSRQVLVLFLGCGFAQPHLPAL